MAILVANLRVAKSRIFDRKNRSISDWREWTRPKEEYQWRSSRSAMELARAWFTSAHPITPPEIAALLNSNERTRGAVLEAGWPELQTPLPERGEGRNHDLVLVGNTAKERLLVAIEGKVDETMGPQIGTYWRRSKETQHESFAWRRIETLLVAAFGSRARPDLSPWRELPYQMLTALVGTAIEAANRNAAVGVLIIHEFVTESAKQKQLDKNASEFSAFLRVLGITEPQVGELYGPCEVTTSAPERAVAILVGKAQVQMGCPSI